MKRLADAKQFPFSYVIDRAQEAARAFGAACTSDFSGSMAISKLNIAAASMRCATCGGCRDQAANYSTPWCGSRRLHVVRRNRTRAWGARSNGPTRHRIAVISAPDFWHAAQLPIKRRGADASIAAAQCADELFNERDLDEAAVWRLILNAVEESQRTKPRPGERVN
jgi:hypothetical protein